MKGVDFTREISDEEWRNEFHKIDSGGNEGGNGWISFREFAIYCCNSIVSPEIYCSACGIEKPGDAAYIAPAKPELKQIEFDSAIVNDIKPLVSSSNHRKISTMSCKSILNKSSGDKKKKSKHKVFKNSSMDTRKSMKEQDVGKTNIDSDKDAEEAATESTKILDIEKRKNDKNNGNFSEKNSSIKKSKKPKNRKQVANQKKNLFKKVNKKNATVTQKPRGKERDKPRKKNDKPGACFGDRLTSVTMESDDLDLSDTNNYAVENINVRATKSVVNIAAVEKEEEENRRKALESYVRPMYRPRSTGQIHQEIKEYKVWVSDDAIEKVSHNSWISQDSREDKKNTCGFGIHGVDEVSFQYDMVQVNEEAIEHKKYLIRKKPRGKLWDPKNPKRKYPGFNSATCDMKLF